MITDITIQNFRSFVDAKVALQPFNLVIGANGSGKSNLLRAVQVGAGNHSSGLACHRTLPKSELKVRLWNGVEAVAGSGLDGDGSLVLGKKLKRHKSIHIFNLQPDKISAGETIVKDATVGADGSGCVQVLDTLKSGAHEDLFDKVQEMLRRYVPEVEWVKLLTVADGKRAVFVKEQGLPNLTPANELSEGTLLILCILTIIHQENPPPIILLEDIDRGMHPRIFEYIAPLMKAIAVQHDINILATTHNPYLVDCFQDDKEAVIIVEKKDGATTLTTLASRMADFGEAGTEDEDPYEVPLGNLWFSGLVGGTPRKISLRDSR